MRKYTNQEINHLEEVRCNQCGRLLKVEKGVLKEGCFHAEHSFGYFSKQDGMRHRFDLCEECYEKVVKNFVLPVEVIEENELL